MNIANIGMADLLGMVIGLFFTLSIFSYALGDNVFFRVASSIFVGVAAGFAVIAAWVNVIYPQLILSLFNQSRSTLTLIAIPLVMSGMMLLKISPRLSRFGNPSMAYLVGVGMATAIGGAVTGTIFPQVTASINLLSWDLPSGSVGSMWIRFVEGSIILVGTITTLVYFHFGMHQQPGQTPSRLRFIEWLAWVGQIFIAITMGVLFSGVFSAALAALIERIHFLWNIVSSIF
jgi:hypothetical protein